MIRSKLELLALETTQRTEYHHILKDRKIKIKEIELKNLENDRIKRALISRKERLQSLNFLNSKNNFSPKFTKQESELPFQTLKKSFQREDIFSLEEQEKFLQSSIRELNEKLSKFNSEYV